MSERAPNIEVDYGYVPTSEIVYTCRFHDPGFINSDKQFIWPMYGCGRIIGPPPQRPQK